MRGGAVPETDENGVQAATAEERMARIERGYGPGWRTVTPDVREALNVDRSSLRHMTGSTQLYMTICSHQLRTLK